MSRQATVAPLPGPPRRGARMAPASEPGLAWSQRTWALTLGGVVATAILWVAWTRMRPEYDAFGWLAWGRQALDGSLNTQGAPSWKPITFAFTLPYALAGSQAQMYLWMVTAVAGALLGAVIAGRLAFTLSEPSQLWVGLVAAAFAAAGVLGLAGYSHLVLIANSDPLVVTLCLASVDAHLCERPRLAFVCLVPACLGRPEAWAFAALYAGWLWRGDPGARPGAVAGLLLIPAAWFAIPALTSHSAFIAGDNALHSPSAIAGDKLTGVLGRLGQLLPLPVKLAAVAGGVPAVVRRDRVWLALVGAVLLWTAIEVAFAYHGWSAVGRYLIEPAAVIAVLAGATVGVALDHGLRHPGLQRWVAYGVVLALIGALVPTARSRAQLTHGEIDDAHRLASELSRLQAVIAGDGGAARIMACGQPVTALRFESTLAWALDLNVIDVGYIPGQPHGRGKPVVYFEPYRLGWRVLPYRLRSATARECERLRSSSSFG